MKRTILVVCAVVALCLLAVTLPNYIPSSIDYRGEKIKLSKFYLSYEDYKDDPDNIDPAENAHVERLVSEAPIAHSFANRKDIATAVFEIKFPGYAAGGFSDGKNDSNVAGFLVEIPRTNKCRYFTFKKDGARYLLVDDFIDSTMPGINHVEENGGKLVYSMDGHPERLVRVMMTRNEPQ